MSGENQYFSVIAFFILVREATEASVIVAVLLQCMNRVMPSMKRQVWAGAAAGTFCSLCVGAAFVAVYYTVRTELFEGRNEKIFEAVLSMVACFLITMLAFTMLKFANLEKKWTRRLEEAAQKAAEEARQQAALADGTADKDVEAAAAAAAEKAAHEAKHRTLRQAALEKRHAYSIFLLAFVSVFREGVEVVIFVFGVGGNVTISAIPLAVICGLIVGGSIGAFVYLGGRKVKDLKIFFVASTVLLLFIAAGQAAWAIKEIGELTGAPEGDPQPWWNTPMWSIEDCCNDEKGATNNGFFPLMGAMFGYNDSPTPLDAMWYISYWILVVMLVILKIHRGTLFDADAKYRRKLQKQGLEEGDEMDDAIDQMKKDEKDHSRRRMRSFLRDPTGRGWKREQQERKELQRQAAEESTNHDEAEQIKQPSLSRPSNDDSASSLDNVRHSASEIGKAT